MEFPIKVFEIKGCGDESIKLEIAEVFGFPNETSFWGGYDVRCNLEIKVGVYTVRTEHYSSTGALYDFYIALQNYYNMLNGKAIYDAMAEHDLTIEVLFNRSQVEVKGQYRYDATKMTSLAFEFVSDQSYFNEVLHDLKKIVLEFGDNKGIKK